MSIERSTLQFKIYAAEVRLLLHVISGILSTFSDRRIKLQITPTPDEYYCSSCGKIGYSFIVISVIDQHNTESFGLCNICSLILRSAIDHLESSVDITIDRRALHWKVLLINNILQSRRISYQEVNTRDCGACGLEHEGLFYGHRINHEIFWIGESCQQEMDEKVIKQQDVLYRNGAMLICLIRSIDVAFYDSWRSVMLFWFTLHDIRKMAADAYRI